MLLKYIPATKELREEIYRKKKVCRWKITIIFKGVKAQGAVRKLGARIVMRKISETFHTKGVNLECVNTNTGSLGINQQGWKSMHRYRAEISLGLQRCRERAHRTEGVL